LAEEVEMRWFPTGVICLGVALLIQAAVITALFLAESRKNIDPADVAAVRLSVVEFRTGQMVSSVVGSVAGCFAAWMVLLYLKTRRLERQIAELREQTRMGVEVLERGRNHR
jgi:hypothetical protein